MPTWYLEVPFLKKEEQILKNMKQRAEPRGVGARKGSQEEREADSEASPGRKDQNEMLGAK